MAIRSVYKSRPLSYSQRKSSEIGGAGGGASKAANTGRKSFSTTLILSEKTEEVEVLGSQVRLRATSVALSWSFSGSWMEYTTSFSRSLSAFMIFKCVFCGMVNKFLTIAGGL